MDETGRDNPTSVLREEHQIILSVLTVVRRLLERAREGTGFEADALGQCVEFFRLFADACHHAKEEDLLFPVLESRGIPRDGGPIGMMLYEHGIARELTRQMGEAHAAACGGDESAVGKFCALAEMYDDLLTRHIYKEDNVLFMMGDQVMRETDQQELCSRFCEAGCRKFGGRKREELTQLAEALVAEWGDDQRHE